MKFQRVDVLAMLMTLPFLALSFAGDAAAVAPSHSMFQESEFQGSGDQKTQEQEKSDQKKTEGEADQDKAQQDKAQQDKAQQDKAQQDKAQQDKAQQDRTGQYSNQEKKRNPYAYKFEPPKNWVRLAKKREIWADMKKKEVIVGGKICLEKGQLELFACSMETKTHESIITVNARSSEVHAALLAIGAKPGNPVKFDPKYEPAKGPKIAVVVRWKKDGKWVEKTAQEMITNTKTKKPLDKDFVFGGSMIWEDPDTGEKVYYGDSGDFICVSNFTSATLDLPINSSASNELLAYETNSKNIPPLGTKVYVHLRPVQPKKKDEAKDKEAESAKSKKDKGKADSDKAGK